MVRSVAKAFPRIGWGECHHGVIISFKQTVPQDSLQDIGIINHGNLLSDGLMASETLLRPSRDPQKHVGFRGL